MESSVTYLIGTDLTETNLQCVDDDISVRLLEVLKIMVQLTVVKSHNPNLKSLNSGCWETGYHLFCE